MLKHLSMFGAKASMVRDWRLLKHLSMFGGMFEGGGRHVRVAVMFGGHFVGHLWDSVSNVRKGQLAS